MPVTQIQGQKAKQCIVINGIEWHLKKDATDSTVIFPFERMNWVNAGCHKINDRVYCCWILGIIPPTPNSLEKPTSVFTLGFNSTYVPMSPGFITRDDMNRMHYYVSDYGDFVTKFVSQFLGLESPETQGKRPAMSPFPDIVEATQTEAVQSPQIQPTQPQHISDEPTMVKL